MNAAEYSPTAASTAAPAARCSGGHCYGSFSAAFEAASSTPPIATWAPRRRSSSRATSLERSPPSVRHQPLSSTPQMAAIPYHPGRFMGRNVNGTIAMTTQPSNESELQLYRVLQRANLLAYYDIFICQGGDDLQQLCDAGEEEFLEIMQLVGMTNKPLHVRRLQKALQEWVTNPALFQSMAPFPSPSNSTLSPMSGGAPSTGAGTGGAGGVGPLPPQSSSGRSAPATVANNSNNSSSGNHHSSSGGQHSHIHNNSHSSSQQTSNHSSSHHNQSQQSALAQNSPNHVSGSFMQATFTGNMSTPSPNQFPNPLSLSEYSQPCSPVSMNPVLLERQIQRLAEAANTLVKNLPPMELKPLLNGNKKRINKDIENIMSMSEDDPRRMEAIRKYAAIYGRFDCKRKPEKPLTLHEVSVNEAAAQICSKIPTLLYRRDELFPLARQVVRDSGYQYSKGHSRSQSCRPYDDSNSEQSKRRRTESSPMGNEAKNAINEEERKRRQDRLEGIIDQLKSLGNKQEELKGQIQEANERQNFQEVSTLQNELEIIADHQMQLVNEKAELEKQQRRAEKAKDGEKMDDDTDSQFSMYSSESTPSLLQDSQQDSPSAESALLSVGQSVMDVFSSKPLANKKAKMSSTGGTSIGSLGNGGGGGSSNSNDSLDFASKQLLNEALIDEGLRMAKEMGHALSDENIDLRLFNKYTEALRNSNCFASLLPGAIGAEQSSTGNGNANNGNNGNGTSSGGSGNIVGSSVVTGTNSSSSSHTRALKEGGHRPRGRPPKNAAAVSAERCAPDLQSTFYEQIFSQAQLQQQMIANYQTQALQAALAFDFAGLAGAGPNPFAGGNGGDGNNNNNGSSSNNNSDKMDAVASAHLTDFTMHLSEGKHFGDGGGGGGGAGSGNGGGDGSKDCDAAAAAAAVELLNGCDKDEVAQSLNALISIANAASASEVIKHELSLPSVDFKIA